MWLKNSRINLPCLEEQACTVMVFNPLLSFGEFSFPSYLFLLFQHWFQILWYFYFMFNPWWTRNKLFKFLFRIFWIQLSILICQSHELVFQTRQSTLSKLDSTFYEKNLKNIKVMNWLRWNWVNSINLLLKLWVRMCLIILSFKIYFFSYTIIKIDIWMKHNE